MNSARPAGCQTGSALVIASKLLSSMMRSSLRSTARERPPHSGALNRFSLIVAQNLKYRRGSMNSIRRMAKDMPWQPVTSSHAIERVRFTIKFKQAVPNKLSRQLSSMMGHIRAETRLEGPSSLTSFKLGVQAAADGQQFVTAPEISSNGWQYVRANVQSQPLEAVIMQADQLIYETAEYRRWDTFVQRFRKVVLPLVTSASVTLDTDAISLEYFDRFMFIGPTSSAQPGKLLRNVEHLLHADACSGRTMWHLHRGWFEAKDQGDVLINQNFDAVDGTVAGKPEVVRSIAMLTKAEVRSANFAVEDVPTMILLEVFHSLTKFYFREALQPEYLPMVGILQEKTR